MIISYHLFIINDFQITYQLSRFLPNIPTTVTYFISTFKLSLFLYPPCITLTIVPRIHFDFELLLYANSTTDPIPVKDCLSALCRCCFSCKYSVLNCFQRRSQHLLKYFIRRVTVTTSSPYKSPSLMLSSRCCVGELLNKMLGIKTDRSNSYPI